MGPGISIIAAGAITGIAQIVRGKMPSTRLIAGVGILGAALLALGRKSPETASRIGATILLTAVMVNGIDLAKAINNTVNRDEIRPAGSAGEGGNMIPVTPDYPRTTEGSGGGGAGAR